MEPLVSPFSIYMIAVLGQIKTNCGHDAFLQLKKEYSTTVKKYGEGAMFELVLVSE